MTLIYKVQSTKGNYVKDSGDSTSSEKGQEAAVKQTRKSKEERVVAKIHRTPKRKK
jgi:hypothetical protein